jgi:hypothetical protein
MFGLQLRFPAVAVALLAAGLLLFGLGGATTSAAKPVPEVSVVSVTEDHLGTTCRFAVHLEWVDLHGPGVASLELVGSANASNASFRSNAGGVDVYLWPAGGPHFDALDILVTKKSGRTALLTTLKVPTISCPVVPA